MLYEAYITIFRKSRQRNYIHIDMETEKKIRQVSLVGDSDFLHRLQPFVRFPITTPANNDAVHV